MVLAAVASGVAEPAALDLPGLLGVSRPTVVRLVESGALAAERNGNRRLLLSDVLAYSDRRRARQYAMLTAVDIDDEDDPAEVIARLREARRAAVERRG